DKKEEPAKEEKKPAGPFGDLDLDTAYLRLRRVTTLPGNEGNLELLPNGEKAVFSGADGKESALYVVKTDGTGQQKISGPGSVQGLNFAGDRVVVVNAGVASSIGLGEGKSDPKTYDIAETIQVDLEQQCHQKFMETSRVLGEQ